MAYTVKPISDRVAKMREKYRNTKPEICIARYRIITEFYMNNPQLEGCLLYTSFRWASSSSIWPASSSPSILA